MLEDTPSHIIGRPVRIALETINVASTAAVHIPFVDAWATNPVIAKALSPYTAIRPTFEIQFLSRCSSTIYGAMMVGFYYGPETKPYPYTVFKEAVQLSTAHSHIATVASSEAITMNVPFIYPYDWALLAGSTKNELATAFIQSLGINSLEAGADTDVNIEVWATCTDIQVTGFVAQATLSGIGLAATSAAAIGTLNSFTKTSDSIRSLVGKVKVVDSAQAQNVTNGFPAYGASVGVRDADYGDLNSLQRQTQLPRLTEMEINHKVDPKIYGDTLNHKLADIASNASYLGSYQFSTVNDVYNIDLLSSNFGIWHSYIMQHFRFFRGRPKFKMWFITSPLLAFRFQISYSPASFTAMANNSDIPKMNFLVKGSQEVIVEIPFITYYPVLSDNLAMGELKIECTQLATSLTTTGNSSCYLVIAAMMGEDTQYFSVCAPKYERYTGQSLRAAKHEAPNLNFSTLPHQKTTLYDEVETVEELMSRWSTRDKTPDSNGVLDNTLQKNPTHPTAFAKWGDLCDTFTCLFTLYRGSRDFRIKAISTTSAEDLWVSAAQYPVSYGSQLGQLANGTQYFSSKTKTGVGGAVTFEANVEFTSPWLTLNVSDTVYNTTFGDTEPNPIDTNVEVGSLWSRAGPDYQVFVLNMVSQAMLEGTLTPIPP